MRRTSIVVALLATVAACDQAPSDEHLDIVFDVCAPLTVVAPSATEAQRADIARGLDLWRARGITTLSLDGPAEDPTVAIRFEDAAPAFHGLYEDEVGVIYLNDDLTAEPLAVTVAHELGHAFGLWHVEAAERPSVMNPGNTRIVPNHGDLDELVALWGTCAGAPAAP